MFNEEEIVGDLKEDKEKTSYNDDILRVIHM
jgi:hypothetical protein